MNGWQLLHALGEQGPDLPSMVVSSYGDAENVRRAEEGDAAGLVLKPVGFMDLREKVAEPLDDGSR